MRKRSFVVLMVFTLIFATAGLLFASPAVLVYDNGRGLEVYLDPDSINQDEAALVFDIYLYVKSAEMQKELDGYYHVSGTAYVVNRVAVHKSASLFAYIKTIVFDSSGSKELSAWEAKNSSELKMSNILKEPIIKKCYDTAIGMARKNLSPSLSPSTSQPQKSRETLFDEAKSKADGMSPQEAVKMGSGYSDNDMQKTNTVKEAFFLSAAERGNTEAMRKLGDLYDNRRAYAEALNWYLRFAQSPEAKNNGYFFSKIGDFYFNGWGTPVNYSKALEYYKAAKNFHMIGKCEQALKMNF